MKHFSYILNRPRLAQTLATIIDCYGYEFNIPLTSICYDLGISKATAVRRLKWLSDNGYIIITKESHKQGNNYKLKKARALHFIAKMETSD